MALGRSDVHIVFRARRLQRSSLPDVNVGWLDDIWVKMDREVDEQLRKHHERTVTGSPDNCDLDGCDVADQRRNQGRINR